MTTRKIYCPAKQDNWVCTLEDGHTGLHEAGGTQGYVHERWPQAFPAPKDHPATKHLFDPEFFKDEPPAETHSVLFTLKELAELYSILSGNHEIPEVYLNKVGKALKAAL